MDYLQEQDAIMSNKITRRKTSPFDNFGFIEYHTKITPKIKEKPKVC
jgi:hypothetical protein